MGREPDSQDSDLVPLNEAAKSIGASPNRLLTWERKGLVTPVRDRRRRRYYHQADAAKLARWHSWQQRRLQMTFVVSGGTDDPDMVLDLSQEEAQNLISLGFLVAVAELSPEKLPKRKHRAGLNAIKLALSLLLEQGLAKPLVPTAEIAQKSVLEAWQQDHDVAALAGRLLSLRDEQVRAVLQALADDPDHEEIERVLAEFHELRRLEKEWAKAERARRGQDDDVPKHR